MDSLQFEIARFLASKAALGQRTTYQEVGEAVGWNHPNGRGLGAHLEVILLYLAEKKLPPLTTVLVRKGERHPHEDAMEYIRKVLGDIDIEAAQQGVFAFDWASVPELQSDPTKFPDGREVWLTSFWGFNPSQWGCIGFADEAKRNRFLTQSRPGTLVAIYVTKGKGPEDMRGKVVGVLELSHEAGHAQNYISGDRWREKELDPTSQGKWLCAVKATRAWSIVPEDWKRVEDIFPEAYNSAHPEFIGASGVKVGTEEAEKLFRLDVQEVHVYGSTAAADPTIQTLKSALSPSRAVPPPAAPYTVGETDGPKFLYILKLDGDVAAYLGCPAADVEEQSIIKVGFSKSPLARRNQIQSAYPAGSFQWQVLFPVQMPDEAPYANAAVAIVGEDAMKKRLVDEKAKVLGGEFFLAEDWLLHITWTAGNHAAQRAQDEYESESEI
ncbi:hypothetical protein [Gemmobacter sp. 24YEA27]|uniref:hypothetical protein n=1 Tax=Gemmobacter sp. 24YEA27 TaxID=3040672 RepID=UPI0024B3B79F|nr:hypothetical protein [Gemmobacter sp. 24YEA27]